ncbi:tRNA1(Val) (adenine(37)-N6)-methyltransferase [Sodalis sp. RH21]|uniref:tRNA1(Val) (adenine(37)-N6)-methyltransferase n=1 Tax=unclassified Sodalis (in: enterobacteria) TaxID=2636512 RepID=UPI0039B43FA6
MMIDSPKQKNLLRRDGFTFKQFFAAHDRCAMKVGTDGVLLGAWTPLARAQRVLDIGTGCGVIALMVAQRTGDNVQVDGIELDARAAGQAGENFALSPWSRRLRIIHGDILDYASPGAAAVFAGQNTTGQYDVSPRAIEPYELIVSNPPYFPVGIACSSPERDSARYTATLTHQRLLDAARALLAPSGLFSMVLPLEVGENVIALARKQGWHLHYRTDVADREGQPAHRVLLAFSPRPGELVYSAMALRDADRRYSPAYRALTGEFYLSLSGVATSGRQAADSGAAG